MSWPFVSIGMVTYNKKEILKQSLRSILNIDYPAFEVIVVDASTDGSNNLIEEMKKDDTRISHIRDLKNMSQDMGYNLIIDIAKGDYIATLDDDMIVDPQWLKELVSAMMQLGNNLGGISPNVINVFDMNKIVLPILQASAQRPITDYLGNTLFSKRIQKMERTFYAYNGCGLFKKNVLVEVGKYDPIMEYSLSEVDLGWRFGLRGYEAFINPRSKVYHVRIMYSPQRFPERTLYYKIRNHIIMLMKNYEIANVVRYLPLFVSLTLTQCIYHLFKGDRRLYLRANLKAYWWCIKNLGCILSSRRKVQHMRKISDKEIKKKMVKPRITIL